MKPRLIVIDGKTYNSVSEMPDDVRRQYEQAMASLKDQDKNNIPDALEQNAPILTDKNNNGIPDVLENTAGSPFIARALNITVDGQQFNSLDDLPPEARAKYEKAMAKLDANRNGIPDFMEPMMNETAPQVPSDPSAVVRSTIQHASRQPMSVTPTIEDDKTNVWLLVLLAGLLLFVCGAAGAGIWYFFPR